MEYSNAALNMAVVGVGALGRHHARILSHMPGVNLLAVADPNEEQGRRVADACGAEWTNDYRNLLKSVDAVSIVVPTSLHRQVGEAFLSHSVPVLIEKPLAGKVADGEVLVRLAQEHDVALQVGHIERFNPAFQMLNDWTDEPKYLRSERLSPYAFRSMDIGVVHDLMIHDIELCLALTQEMPCSIDAFGVSLLGGHEDVVQARLSFPNGCIADLTANRVCPTAVRMLHCWSEAGCAIADLNSRKVQTFAAGQRLTAGELPFELATHKIESIETLKQQIFTEFIAHQEIQAADDDALTAELAAFVECVRQHRQPLVSGSHGLAALRVAGQILERVAAHQWDATPSGRIGAQALIHQTSVGVEQDAAAAA